MTLDNKPKKKRGRKPKKKNDGVETKVPKKRGRKPRGGKIVSKSTDINKTLSNVETNIILHLKCNTSELEKKTFSMLNSKYNPKISQPDPFSLNSNQKLNTLTFENINENESSLNTITTFKKDLHKPLSVNNKVKEINCNDNIDIKEIWKKLSNLKYQLHFNCLQDKR